MWFVQLLVLESIFTNRLDWAIKCGSVGLWMASAWSLKLCSFLKSSKRGQSSRKCCGVSSLAPHWHFGDTDFQTLYKNPFKGQCPVISLKAFTSFSLEFALLLSVGGLSNVLLKLESWFRQ